MDVSSLLLLAHLTGLALGLGCATGKLALLLRCRSDPAYPAVFIAVARPLTRLIIVGLGLLVLSGIGWLIQGHVFTTLLIVKLALVAAIIAVGPVIDNVVEPSFRELAPAAGEAPSREFERVLGRYVALEITATALFYAVVAIWTLA